MKMFDFVLIHLESQRRAVAEYVKGWKPEDVLNWMQQFGTVDEILHSYGGITYKTYGFISISGLFTAFFFTEDGELSVMR